MVFARNGRFRVMVAVVALALGCLAVGIWIHHRLIIAQIHTAGQRSAALRLSRQTESTRRALLAVLEPDSAGQRRSLAELRALFESDRADVGWLLADPQWNVVAVLREAEGMAEADLAADGKLSWRPISTPDENPSDCLTGLVKVGKHRHVAVAVPESSGEWYLVAHQPLGAPSVGVSGLIGPMRIGALTAWFWAGALSTIVVYLLVTRFFDRLQRERSSAEAKALQWVQSLVCTRDAILCSLASLAESRDEGSERHLDRVALYARRLASALRDHPRFRDQVTQKFIELLGAASMLHDIGKIGIEDAILFKPGPLTRNERKRMEQHTVLGDRYLARVEQRLGDSAVIRMARQIALRHHERWDGKGYPDGLAGEQIPLAARIVAIADVYEALTNLRDYKPPYSHQRCIKIIQEGAGKQFDPDLVAAFLEIEPGLRQFAFVGAGEGPLDEDGSPARPSDPDQCAGLVRTMQLLDPDWAPPLPARGS